jgi:hypothetical protein
MPFTLDDFRKHTLLICFVLAVPSWCHPPRISFDDLGVLGGSKKQNLPICLIRHSKLLKMAT